MHKGLITDIKQAWGWCGISPKEVVAENNFGNLLIRDVFGCYWRLCPEEAYCRVIAKDRKELDEINQDNEFLRDWHMFHLVEKAEALLGALGPGEKYCLLKPGVLGGEYQAGNLAIQQHSLIVRNSGVIGEKIQGLPDGTQVTVCLEGKHA